MPGNLPKRKLLVVSDTALHKRGNSIYGFGAVVRELKELSPLFDEIVWLGCIEKEQLYADTLIGDLKIKCVLMPSVRNRYLNALWVLFAYPVFIADILRHLATATHVHTRAPSHPALISILYSFFDSNRIYWHKYAGDWGITNAPITYRLQKFLLKRLKQKNIRITINGKQNDQSANIFVFENPSVYGHELTDSSPVRNFDHELRLLFVGNLTEAKGILKVLSALNTNDISPRFSELIIIGDGALMPVVQASANASDRIKVLGYLDRKGLKEYYKSCHFLLLPSRSEGFPKVVAEAAAQGCIPIVSDISNISVYVHDNSNGFLIKDTSVEGIIAALNSIAGMDGETLRRISASAISMSAQFTYERFAQRIKEEIFPIQ